MKSTINILTVLLFMFSCKAQNTITLQQAEVFRTSPNGIPTETQFVKDTDNRLNKFTGTWKGTFNGKQVELKLEKKEDFGNNSIKWDKLIGKLRIKDSQGNVLFNSFQNPESDSLPYGVNFQGSAYEMLFFGVGNCNDSGTIFIEIKSTPINGSKMRLFYSRDGDVVDTLACPALLPADWMELTRQ